MSKNSGIGFRQEDGKAVLVNPASSPPHLAPHERELYLARREALLIELRALERVLGLPQSQLTRDERREGRDKNVLSKPDAVLRVERVELTERQRQGLTVSAECIE